jgi:predicted amidohydrolase
LKAGVLQFAPARLDVEGNLSRILAHLAGVRDALVVCPELSLTGYLFRDGAELRAHALAPDAPALDRFYRLLRDNGLFVALGLPEAAPEGVYNSLLLAGPAGPLAVYRKLHLFDLERRVFRPGDAPPPVVEAAGARVGLMICWDWYFPEFARFLARRGAQVIAHAANLVLPWCLDAMRTRSLENRVFSITANRTGAERAWGVRLEFTGRSQVVDPSGDRVLAAGGPEAEGVFLAEIDPAKADDKSITARNAGMSEVRLDLLR